MSLSVSCVQTRSNAINLGLANKSPGSKSVYEKRCDKTREEEGENLIRGAERKRKRKGDKGGKKSGERKNS